MSEHLVAYCPYDLLEQQISDAGQEVSWDGGQTWRDLVANERKDGFAVVDGQKFVARISKPGLWAVTQRLRIDAADPPECKYDGPPDPRAYSLFSHTTANSGRWRHMFYASLTLFRDASPDRAQRGYRPLPDYRWNMFAFDGAAVLSTAGTGLGRFAAHVALQVPSYDPHAPLYPGCINGQLCYVKTPDDAVSPRLAVVFVPDGMDWTKPVPVQVFLTPPTSGKGGGYPWSPTYNAMLDNYLVNYIKRLLNQRNASRKRCVFVFPIPPPREYYNGFLPAIALRRYSLEIVYWLQKTVGQMKFPNPKLGHCAVAAFSRAGDPLLRLVQTSTQNEFPELREVYGLDIVCGAGVDAFADALLAWWQRGATGRSIRFYESDYAGADWQHLGPRLSLPVTRKSAGGAFECQGTNASTAFLPVAFWSTAWTEDPQTHLLGYFPDPPNGHTLHQVIPGIFMEHALRNSGFPDV
jgi:hypothetical protein